MTRWLDQWTCGVLTGLCQAVLFQYYPSWWQAGLIAGVGTVIGHKLGERCKPLRPTP